MGRCSIPKRTIQMTELVQLTLPQSIQMTVRRAINLFGPMFATTAGHRGRGCSPLPRGVVSSSPSRSEGRGESPHARHSIADSSLTLSGRSLLREPPHDRFRPQPPLEGSSSLFRRCSPGLVFVQTPETPPCPPTQPSRGLQLGLRTAPPQATATLLA